MKLDPHVPRGLDYLRVLRDQWIVILCAAVLSGFGGWLAWDRGDQTYYSFSQVLIITPGGAMPTDAFYGNFTAKAWIPTYVELPKSRQVLVRTIEQVGLSMQPEELAEDITVGFGNSALLQITVSGDDPSLTAETANAVTTNVIGLSRQMASVNTGGTELVLVDAATPPIRHGSLKRNLILSTSLGLTISVLLVLAVALIKGRVLGGEQVARLVDAELRDRNR